MNLLFIAASDMDMIIGIIAVIVWIVSQLFGKKKVDSSSPEESTPESATPADPRDELRRFFEELEKSTKPRESQSPASPPPLHPKPTRETPARRLPALTVAPPPSPPPAPEYRVTDTPWTPPDSPLSALPATIVKPQTISSIPELRDTKALRKFIIANEILGKPVALKQA